MVYITSKKEIRNRCKGNSFTKLNQISASEKQKIHLFENGRYNLATDIRNRCQGNLFTNFTQGSVSDI